MTDELPPDEQIERYRQQHPDAEIPAIAGATGLDPATVADVLEDEGADAQGRARPRAEPGSPGVNPGGSVPKTTEHGPDSSENEASDSGGGWTAVDWSDPDPDTFPPAWGDLQRWMNRIPDDKHSFAPWGDRNAPAPCSEEDHTTADECPCDARYKWGYTENYADLATAREWNEMHPGVDGYTFQLLEADEEPFAFVDGDDVRDPETGEVHPAFVELLERLGVSYADVSTSGSGVHVAYRGDLPEGVKQANVDLDDEPFGDNDELPAVEIYDHKHVCVATGDHLPGSGLDVNEWDEDALEDWLDEHGLLPDDEPHPGADTELDLTDHDPEATEADEITTDRRDVFHALDQLDAQRVASRTIVRQWNDDATTSDGTRAFHPTWGVDTTGTANIVDDQIWQDTGGNGYGGPAVMAAIDDGLVDEDAQPSDVRGETWIEAVDHLRSLRFDVPLYLPDAEAADGDTMPYWAVRRGALFLDVCDEADLVERDGEDGGTYRGFPDAETYNAALAALEEHGLDTGRDPVDPGRDPPTPDEYRRDPREVDVVLEPQRAWDAAGRVTPDDLDEDLPLEATADGDAWRCPVTDARVADVARAVAIAEDLVASAEAPLADDYARAYQRARAHYGAPLPRYLTAADAVARFDYVIGAVRELTFHHLDRDALTAEITGEGLEVSGEAQLTLDPTPVDGWRDSESGESVLVFPSGTIYDCHLGGDGDVIDALRFVALDAGLLAHPDDALEGDTFTRAYSVAREQYGAPLPRWDAGEPDVTPVLPPASELVEDPTVEADALEELRADVEALYGDLAIDAEQPQVLRALPALGKTTAAIKTARQQPTTYLAARKELMAQAEQKAQNWGVSALHLPVFAEEQPRTEALDEAVAYVREQGKRRLRERWSIHGAVDGPLWPDEACDDEEIDLERASCPTANGEYDEAWALAVHVAYQLDYTPRDIHERSEALFGAPLPCQHDGDCPYSRGWEAVADHDAPADLLIGNYVHANVESARTYYTRDEGDRRTREPRTLVVDEYPGQAYAEQFGPEALDHAVWLASALRDDVDDRQDLLERDLWSDPFVRAWLQGEAVDEDGPAHDLDTTLAARVSAHEAATTAEEILERYDELLAAHDLQAPLQRLVEGYPALDLGERAALAGEITTAVGQVPPEADGFSVLQWVANDVGDPLARSTEAELTPDLDVLPADGELRAFVEQALEAADELGEGVGGMLRAARTAVAGGDDGARELAVWADHGYAHRQAHYLLEAVIRPGDDDVATIPMTNYTFGSDADETTGKQVEVRDRVTVLLDRNHHGAVVHAPPERTSGSGDPAPLVGLDATGREALWSFAVGEDVVARDVHDGPRDRAECLREVHGLQLVQTTDLVKSYEGDPDGKNLDADVALLEEIADRFAGIHAARERDAEDVVLDEPAVITTKVVREVLEDDARTEDVVKAWENYGNLKGSNELRQHQLAALLGCQHYGDHEIELLAALEGEAIERSGWGHDLDYGSDIANAYLKHMREDQVMQAALRFARGETGALVFAHTGALREDLPVVGEGQVVKSWSETATAIAREWRRHPDGAFTAGDVADAVDVQARQVRRVLAEFVDAGYLERHDPGQGLANEYTPLDEPGAGEVALEDELAPQPVGDPGQEPFKEYYTANVRVTGVESDALPRARPSGSTLPAPGGDRVAVEGDPPPG